MELQAEHFDQQNKQSGKKRWRAGVVCGACWNHLHSIRVRLGEKNRLLVLAEDRNRPLVQQVHFYYGRGEETGSE